MPEFVTGDAHVSWWETVVEWFRSVVVWGSGS